MISSPLGRHGDEIDHLAFLQEPMSDEEDELDIENIQKEIPSSSQLSTASVVGETRDTSLNFKEEQLSQAFPGWLGSLVCICLSFLFLKYWDAFLQ